MQQKVVARTMNNYDLELERKEKQLERIIMIIHWRKGQLGGF